MTDRPPENDERAFAFVLNGDVFLAHFCVRCSSRAALFAVRGDFVGLCPLCVCERIARLRASGFPLPSLTEVRATGELLRDRGSRAAWIVNLEDEAQRYVVYSARREDGQLSVDLDVFVRCVRCDKLVAHSDTRSARCAGQAFLSPHCEDCYERSV